jgi:hypothetical protein
MLGNIAGFSTSTNATSSYAYAERNYANPHAAPSIGSKSLTYDNNCNTLTVGNFIYTRDHHYGMTLRGFRMSRCPTSAGFQV